MVDNLDSVTVREWKLLNDAHSREHAIESKHQESIARILDTIRLEAKEANDVRLEGMNDLRRQLDRQAATFITLDKWESSNKAGADAIAAIGIEVNRRLGIVENKQSNMDGKIAVVSFITAIVASGITGLIVYAITN